MRRSLIPLAAVVAALVVAAPASAFRVGHAPRPVADNPADHLVDIAPDPEVYDTATHCSPTPKPGMTAFVGWLQRHADGVFWGTYRCERWGRPRTTCRPPAVLPSECARTRLSPPRCGSSSTD